MPPRLSLSLSLSSSLSLPSRCLKPTVCGRTWPRCQVRSQTDLQVRSQSRRAASARHELQRLTIHDGKQIAVCALTNSSAPKSVQDPSTCRARVAFLQTLIRLMPSFSRGAAAAPPAPVSAAHTVDGSLSAAMVTRPLTPARARRSTAPTPTRLLRLSFRRPLYF